MTTTVNRVYVDAEGVVRMSPTGWPEKPTEGQNWPYLKGVKYETLLQKAKKESIPFEDQKHIKSIIFESNILDRGKLYTIEPIQVELVYTQWCDKSTGECHRCEYIQGTHGAQDCKHPTIRVARIVTEKPVSFPAKRVIRDETGKAIGFEPFIKEPAPNIINQDDWTLSRVKMPDFDGPYYVYGFMHHSCGNVTPFHKIVECKMNQWVKSDLGEQMTYWRNLLTPPVIKEDEYQ